MYENDWKSLQDIQRKADQGTVARFYWGTIEDGPATLREGRKIEVPLEVLDVILPADRQSNLIGVRAHSVWRRVGNDDVTYAMRFEDQYRRFRANEQQVVSGTPIASVEWLDGGQKAILKTLNVTTVEQLAGLSGQALKNLGAGGMAWQQAAAEYIRTTKEGAEVTNLIRENAALKESMAALGAGGGADPRLKYAEMADANLKEMIKDATGEAPRGNPSRATLIRMLLDIEAQAQAPAKAA